jgi:penicillin amidase
MEMVRHLAQGRLSEMIGPIAVDLDHLARILDFGRAVPGILETMPAGTRQWIEAFVSGINHHLRHARQLPHEFAVLKLRREPWSAVDVLTVGRLMAADVNWLAWFQLLRLRQRNDWPRIWRRLMGSGEMLAPDLAGESSSRTSLLRVLGFSTRWASNSLAVSPSRSASGGALLASDPHLGIQLPNFWLVAGYKSPSHHAVGMMAPGLPFIALGRNPWIAWGAVNMHAASSDLFDVSDLPQDDIRERRQVIKVRWSPDREVVLRDTPLGPIVSDARLFGLDRARPIALRWVGHQPSDEITAMVKVSQARNWGDFRAAIDGFAVCGLAMTYADADGHIGKAMAVKLPARFHEKPHDLLLARGGAGHWQRFVTGSGLPACLDPPQGWVVAANERPEGASVPVGFFFSPPDRAQRLAALMASCSHMTVERIMEALSDVYVATSMDLCRQFLDVLRSPQFAPLDGAAARFEALLAGWDGRYRAQSREALAFELLFENFVRAFYSGDETSAYWATWCPRALVRDDIAASPPEAVAFALTTAIRRSARGSKRLAAWGDKHRLKIAHVFGLVPFFGRRYVDSDSPAAGSSDSVLKTGHRFGAKRHAVTYASNARHVSDLSDPDGNYFVLLGGQDGWIGSANYADQIGLWRRQEYVRIPLRPKTVRADFPHRTELLP